MFRVSSFIVLIQLIYLLFAVGDELAPHYDYLIVDKNVCKTAKNDAERRKSVKYWGYTNNLKNRREGHKTTNGFGYDNYGMLLSNKWAPRDLPTGISSPHQAALAFEHIVDGFREDFDSIGKAGAGNGRSDDPIYKQLAKRQDLIKTGDEMVTEALREGAFDVFGVSSFCDKFQLIVSYF